MKRNHLKTKVFISAILAAAMTALPVNVSAEAFPPLSYFIKTEGSLGSGDLYMDGTEDISDFIWLKRYVIGKAHNFTPDICMRADLNLDGNVNIFDLTMLKRDICDGRTREHISWSINKVIYTEEFYQTLENDYVITSKSELAEYIDSIYMNYYQNTADDTIGFDDYTNIRISYMEAYSDEFFEDNVLLLKPILQTECEDILYNIDSISYGENTIDIGYTRNYDSLRAYDSVVNALLAEIKVPKSLYNNQTVSWNYNEKDWHLGYYG